MSRTKDTYSDDGGLLWGSRRLCRSLGDGGRLGGRVNRLDFLSVNNSSSVRHYERGLKMLKRE